MEKATIILTKENNPPLYDAFKKAFEKQRKKKKYPFVNNLKREAHLQSKKKKVN